MPPNAALPAGEDEIELPVVPNADNYIIRECQHAIGRLVVLSKRNEAPKDEVKRVVLLLNWLETRTWGPSHVLPSTKSKLINTLKAVYDTTRPETIRHFTPEIQARAAVLHTRWAATDVEDAGPASEDNSDDEVTTTTVSRSRAPATIDTQKLRLPHRNHPIFGVKGIMHGLFITGSKRKTYRINPFLKSEQRDPSQLGDNGLTAGDWWPLQVAAVFNGAHGSWSGGIAGKKDSGAVSIVTSGFYEDLDQDNGDVLFYSGSGSHDHTIPSIVKETSGTQLMRIAQTKGNRIRVLRSSSGGGGSWCPNIGIRYDGLYRIVGSRNLKNKLGGLYEQFELHRLPGQPDLLDIQKRVPTGKQKQQYEEMKKGY
ncbi:hypothetical protein ACHAQA_006406 [Verticillium albo-atrum]